MAIEAKETSIGEFRYLVRQLPGRQSARVLTRLVKVFGPMMEQIGKQEGWKALAALVTNLTVEDTDYFIDAFAPMTEVILPSGKSPVLNGIFDVHFQGRAKDMVEWLAFCLKVNYSDFFGVLGVGGAPESPESKDANPSG